MKYLPGFLFLLMTIAGCKQKSSSSKEELLEQKLINTMSDYLKKDKPEATFVVKDVIYFKEKDFFTCEFDVRMQAHGVDTVGKMKATISNDLSTVKRIY